MARPQRNTVDYFPFYCEDGNKMFYLEETYGNDGFAVFVKLLRELARTDYHYLDLSKNTTVMFLSAKCKVSKEVLLNIVNDLVELEKFDAELWKEAQIIWCESFIESIQDAYRKRANNCIDKNELIHLLTSKETLKPSKRRKKQEKGSGKGDVKPQIKEEEIKEEKKQSIDWEVLIQYINEKTGKKLRVINENIRKKYNARLREGYTKDNIRIAIDNAVKAQNHKDSNFKYLTPEFFSRSDKLDMYGMNEDSITKDKRVQVVEEHIRKYGKSE